MLSSVGKGGKGEKGFMMVRARFDKTAKGFQHPMEGHPATVVAEFPLNDEIAGKEASKATARGHQVGRKAVEDSEWRGERVVLNVQSGGVGQTMMLDIERWGVI
jgi:hypothetical protein